MTPLIQVKQLKKQYAAVTAVYDLSFDIFEGETLGFVGESGCGKTTTGKMVIGLERPSSGQILFEGKEIATDLSSYRKQAQYIFQDPYASLNPRMTAGDIVAEPLDIHRLAKGPLRQKRLEELFHLVGLDPSMINRFPHEFSGGQRQRIGIARALAVNPRFIVCDEPVSALDVSVQAQILNLLKQLQKEKHLTTLFIAHDLRVVKYLSNRIAVIYLGHIVELAPTNELFSNPKHPYTKALLSAIPIPDPTIERKRQRILLTGDPPSPSKPLQGCPFASRCPLAQDICRSQLPEKKVLENGHLVLCHLA